jgi:hypothetical protein
MNGDTNVLIANGKRGIDTATYTTSIADTSEKVRGAQLGARLSDPGSDLGSDLDTDEFDLSALAPLRPSLLEAGRT